MSGGPKGAKRPLERPFDGAVRRHVLGRTFGQAAEAEMLRAMPGSGDELQESAGSVVMHLKELVCVALAQEAGLPCKGLLHEGGLPLQVISQPLRKSRAPSNRPAYVHDHAT